MKDQGRYSLNLDCQNLIRFGRGPNGMYKDCTKLYHQLCKYPQEVIPLMDDVLTQYYLDLFPDVDDSAALRVRPYNTTKLINMRELNPSDIDQVVAVKGLLIRSSTIIPDMKEAFFRCSVCEFTVTVSADRGRITEPTRCPRQGCQAKDSMEVIHNRCLFSDKQVCRLQETPDVIPDGQTPHTVSMCFYDDLVDVAKPGDR